MKQLDNFLQLQRIKQAAGYITGTSILDIGCHQGELFRYFLKFRRVSGDGIDGVLTDKVSHQHYTLYPGYFPHQCLTGKKYDNITLLAVLEHIPLKQIETFPELFMQYLHPGGRIIITVPSKFVDTILSVLLLFKLIDGMDLEHHQDFKRTYIRDLFVNYGFRLVADKRFELGLNILYVLEKPFN